MKGENQKKQLANKKPCFTLVFARFEVNEIDCSRRQLSTTQDHDPEAGSLRNQRLKGSKHLDKKEKEQLSPTWEVIST